MPFALHVGQDGFDFLLRRGWLAHELLQAPHIVHHPHDHLAPQRLIPRVDGQQLVHGRLVHSQSRAQLVALDFQEPVLKAAAAKFTDPAAPRPGLRRPGLAPGTERESFEA